VGGHAVKVIGYGYDKPSKLQYWIIANSWGSEWGEGGFFRAAWGSLEGFEQNFWKL